MKNNKSLQVMNVIHFKRSLTAQSVLAFLLIVFGAVIVMAALYMPPKGEIHPSVITVFGMILVTAGAFFGIDLNFQFKSFLHQINSPGSSRPTCGEQHRTGGIADSAQSTTDSEEKHETV